MTAIVTAEQLVAGLAARIDAGVDANYEGDNKLLKDAMVSKNFFDGGGGGGGVAGVSSFNGRTGAVTLGSSDIKTVNGQSLLGSGNIDVSGGGGGTSYEVWVQDFGAVGDGEADDSVAFQSAIDSLAGIGGVVRAVGVFKLGSTITLAPNVYLKGNYAMPGPGTKVTATDPPTEYHNIASGALRLSGTATIELSKGAGVDSLIIYRHGQVFPLPNSSSYAGTAITVIGDDASVRNSFILGFNKGVYSSGYQRPIIDFVFLDNNNGIEIASCYDISTVSNCHAWPFATIQFGTDYVKDMRSGTAYHFRDVNDWGKVINCFSYGYKTGFRMHSVNNMVLTGCGTDGPWEELNIVNGTPTRDPWGALNVGSVGFHITGTSDETVLVGCQSAAQENAGVLIDTQLTDSNSGSGRHVTLQSHSIWGAGRHCVLINSGHALIDACTFRGMRSKVSASAVRVANNQSRVLIQQTVFKDLKTSVAVDCNPVANAVEIDDCYVDSWETSGSPYGTSLVVTSAKIGAGGGSLEHGAYIDSASSSLDVTTSFTKTVRIPNGSNIGNIRWGSKNRELRLLFDGASTVYTAPPTGRTSGDIVLSGSTNFTANAGDILSLVHDGTVWREVSRNTPQTGGGGGSGTGVDAGSTTTGYLNYNGVAAAAGRLYGGTTAPTGTTRLNYGGNLYVNELFASSGEMTLSTDVGGTLHSRNVADSRYTQLTLAGSITSITSSRDGGTTVTELIRCESSTASIKGDLELMGRVKAGSSFGTTGQVLVSTGTGVAWSTPSGGGGTGSGTVTTVSVTGNAPISATVSNPTTTPAISISHSSSGVSAGTYGTRSKIPSITVNATGHVTSVTQNNVSGEDAFNIYTAGANTTFQSLNSSGTSHTNCYASAREWVFASNAAVSGATLRLDINKYALVGYETSNGSYRLQVNGVIYATSGTIATSDARYKTNVKPIADALGLVEKLEPVSFDWKKHPVHNFQEGTTVGFLAQDVELAMQDRPYLNAIIRKNHCTLPDGSKEEFMGIAEGNLVSILTAAVKELTAEYRSTVLQLEQQIAQLTETVMQMDERLSNLGGR